MFQTRTLKQGRASKTDVFFRDMDSLKLDVTIWYAEGWHLVATQAKSVVGWQCQPLGEKLSDKWLLEVGGYYSKPGTMRTIRRKPRCFAH